jgi:uncharacterized protein (DUF111 family)
MSPPGFGYLMERAFELGAMDCFFTPVQMKKNRPGVLISILCRPTEGSRLCRLLFTETTTLGVREYEVKRRALGRYVVSVETRYGAIDVKVAHLGGRILNEMPEYEQCQAAARASGMSLRAVEDEVRSSLAASRKEKGDGSQ